MAGALMWSGGLGVGQNPKIQLTCGILHRFGSDADGIASKMGSYLPSFSGRCDLNGVAGVSERFDHHPSTAWSRRVVDVPALLEQAHILAQEPIEVDVAARPFGFAFLGVRQPLFSLSHRHYCQRQDILR